jgi:hypothetical protein
LSAHLLLAFIGIVASKLLSPLLFDYSPLSSTLTPRSQTIIYMFGPIELDTTHPFTYFSNITLPSNSLVMGLN